MGKISGAMLRSNIHGGSLLRKNLLIQSFYMKARESFGLGTPLLSGKADHRVKIPQWASHMTYLELAIALPESEDGARREKA